MGDQSRKILKISLIIIAYMIVFMSPNSVGKEIWVHAQIGSDTNPGTKNAPIKTPELAIELLAPGGGTIHLKGIFYAAVSVKGHIYDMPGLTIDGHNECLVYGFDGEYQQFDPSKPECWKRNWHRVTVSDSQNVTIKNLAVWGGQECAVELNCSNKLIGLKNITLDGLTIRYGGYRNVFMGGSNIDGITIKNCVIRENVYGDTSHGIYLSGGHWTGEWPPVRNVKVLNNEICYVGGRHGIQVNGRFENVEVSGNLIYHCELAGISMIGTQHALIENNVIYGNNKQAIVIYDYEDGWFDPGNPGWDKEAWLACHHPNQDIKIRRNTLVCGPKQWKFDKWHNNKPKEHGVIVFNNEVNKSIEYPPKGFEVTDNIIYSCNESVIRYSNMAEAWATKVRGNIVWTTKAMSIPVVCIPWGDKWFHFSFLEQWWNDWYSGNIVKDPRFRFDPIYPKAINLIENPHYNFGTHPTYADLYSNMGSQLGRGAMLGKGVGIMKKVSESAPAEKDK